MTSSSTGSPELRRLGSTGLMVSPVGLGLAALGRPAYITVGRDQDLGHDRSVSTMERRAHDLLDAAYDAGIRYFDVARSYGRAEDFLGSWLDRRGTRRDEVTVGSKWGYRYVGDWRLDADVHEVKDHSVTTLERQLDETRSRLGGHLDLYQIHSVTPDSGVLEDRAVLARLAELADEGVTVGLTVSGASQQATILRALDVEIDGVNPFRCVQATWNVFEPSAGVALAEAHARGWGVIVKEALANGRLTDHAEPPEPVTTLAHRHGVHADALAIAAVLARDWVDVVLSGAVTTDHLDSNLEAHSVALDQADLSRLAPLAIPSDDYWHQRSQTAWT